MKIRKLLLLVVPFVLSACSNPSSSQKSEQSVIASSSEAPLSSEEESLTSVAPQTSVAPTMTLSTSQGLKVKFANKGAKIDSVDFNGKHIAENGFTAGRVANRIANGTFTLDGVKYDTNKNNGNHTLHGGSQGFGEKTWTFVEQTENSITFSLHSADGDMGFPGNLDMTTKYTLEEDGMLTYEYRATCDAKTIFNPINHLYMNMNGNTSKSNHQLWIDADTYTKASSDLIPTGQIVSVANTNPNLDFRTKKSYGSNTDSNLCLNGTGFRKVAEMDGTTGGYRVEVYTDRVGLQLYSDGRFICMEAQDYPDAIHHDNFPSIVLEANTEYYSKSAYKFTKITQ